MIYQMQAKSYVSAAEMIGASQAARARLMGYSEQRPFTPPEPAERPAPAPVADLPCVLPPPCPMNMLAFPSWKFLRAYVAAKHGVEVRDIESRARRAPVVKARNELCFLMHTHLNLSLTHIGALVERDHSTVLYSISTHRAAMEKADA